eukprot:gene13052-14319_t
MSSFSPSETTRKLLISSQKIIQCLKHDSVVITFRDCEVIASSALHLHESDRSYVYDVIWTNEFIECLLEYVHRQYSYWRYLLIGIGNTVAYQSPSFLHRLLTIPSFVHYLVTSIQQREDSKILHHAFLADEEEGKISFELSIWIVANIIQSLEGNTPPVFYPIIPKLIHILELLLHNHSPNMQVNQPNSFNFHSTSRDETRFDQLKLRIFRALSGIFSTKLLQEIYHHEFSTFKQLLQRFPSLIMALLYEYSLGLEGKKISSINFYPEAYHRALTVWFLTNIPEAKDILVLAGGTKLLTKSLFTKFLNADFPTSLLWSRSIRALYSITANRSNHIHLLNDENIDGLIFLASYRSEEPKISFSHRRMAAEIAVILRLYWDVERLFWIAQSQSAKSCVLSRLPTVLIKPIMMWLVLGESTERYSHRCKELYCGYDARR